VPLVVVSAAVFCLTVLAAVIGERVGRTLQARITEPERIELFSI
jgi:hypothetical protein